MNLLILAAVISGSALVTAFIWIIIAALICWALWWFIGYVGLPEPFNKILRVLVALFALLVVINVLLALAGHPFISW